MLRLRQICLVAPELTKPVAQLESVLGLKTCFHDPGVEKYGLHNALLPIGNNFLEVVAPFREGTTAERYIKRRGGAGGYMVIMQCDDVEHRKHRMQQLDVRIINEIKHGSFNSIQMHPKDTGGAIMETGADERGNRSDGPWTPAGDSWQKFVQTNIVSQLLAAEIQSKAPRILAERWAEVLQIPIKTNQNNQHSLVLENATLRFTEVRDTRDEGLRALDIKTMNRNELIRRAAIVGCDSDHNSVFISGIKFNLF